MAATDVRVIRVMLVDDHPLVRTGLSTLLSAAGDVSVVAEAADGAEAVRLCASNEVDVVLMDLSMPVMDGVAATRQLLADDARLHVVVLSSFSDRARVREAIAAGAVGYVLKDSSPEDVIAAVRAAAAGHAPLDPRVAGALLPTASSDPAAGLSDREIEVLRLASRGLANKQIARSLGIAERTVKVHLGNVFRRIGVSDRTSAALWARDHLP
jgi:DNA-binding NarL/FixJ family response regulator